MDPVSRRKFIAVGGGTSLAAFLAACGGGGSSSSTMNSTTENPNRPNNGKESETAQFGKGDIGILNYALTLEYLEAAFYKEVAKSGLFKGEELAVLKMFGAEEQQHVEALHGTVQKLGGKPAPEPKSEFPLENAKSVAELAGTVENLGAAAYLGQAGEHRKPGSARGGPLDPQRRGAPRGDPEHAAGPLDHPRRRLRQTRRREDRAQVGRTLHRRLTRPRSSQRRST